MNQFPRFLAFLVAALGVAVLLVACGASAPPPDPLAPYRPAFRSESLPPDFDVDAAPRYDIELSVDPRERKVEGVARIHFKNRSGRPMNDLYVRLYPNLPQLQGTMRLTGVSTLPGNYAAGYAYLNNNTTARITLTEPVPPDESIGIEIRYNVEAPDRAGYVLFGASEGILNLPYSYPILAAQTTEGTQQTTEGTQRDPTSPWRLDVPPPHGDIAIADPSFFTITATVPSGITLVASGVEITHTQGISDTVQHILVAGPDREWTMTVSPRFQQASLDVDGIRVNSYFLPEDANAGRSALAAAAAAVRVYDRLFSPYPYTKLDIVESPTRYLGMEYPGLNYIGLDTYRDQSGSQEVLVAHEVAHQWWNGLVNSDPFRYPWLDEGLAEHSSLLFIEMIHGPAAAERMRSLRWQVPVDWAVKNGYDAPAGSEVTAFDGTNYEILVYAKSALFFDALYQALGRDKYLEVLRTFIARYRFKTPTPADFLAVVGEVGGIDPQPIYQKWILSGPKHPSPKPAADTQTVTPAPG
jgi:aminopeptidase N